MIKSWKLQNTKHNTRSNYDSKYAMHAHTKKSHTVIREKIWWRVTGYALVIQVQITRDENSIVF